ncbi:hypothetical protein DY000_02029973 [Brassica cretica]|uniref:Uncharacterized protein n=1 Tax=Brassica cretica TaxID=69181 RepID=A0ABQ7DRD1_BRACR|nr:hypothetical protein DY000_02029973 [Brassica cretica]
MDKKGQTALHMAAKGTNVEVVEELIKADRSSINIADTKGNTALHIADRKGRSHIVKLLLDNNITDTKAVNRTGETALDTAEKVGNPEVALILQKHGVPNAKTIKPSSMRSQQRDQLNHCRRRADSYRGVRSYLHCPGAVHVIGQIVEVSPIDVVLVNGKDTNKMALELRNSAYKLHLIVVDSPGKSKFLLFDNLAVELIHQPCISLAGPNADEDSKHRFLKS